MTKRKFKTNIDSLFRKKLTQSQMDHVKRKVDREVLKIRLSQLRKAMNVKQKDVAGFSQPAVANLEKRADMKLSTLVHYLHAIGMNVEIKISPRHKKPIIPDEMVLLKS